MFAMQSTVPPRRYGRNAFLATVGLMCAHAAAAQTRTFTDDADFDTGVLETVNHTAVHDQLQLDVATPSFSILWIANSARGTLVRIDATTGAVLGEYRTAPLGRLRNPSRTAIDALGNVWTANRSENAMGRGSVVKVGVCIGGTRVAKLPDGTIAPDPLGDYVAPPFQICTAVDRDHDGLIRTSRGLGDVLAWPDVTDGAGGADGVVADADDECILVYQRTSAPNACQVSLDAGGHLWVGAYPLAMFDVLDGTTGAIERSLPLGTGGYGGFIDAQGVLWSTHLTNGLLLRYDTTTDVAASIPVRLSSGLTRGPDGSLWVSMWTNNTVTKLDAQGVQIAGFPVPSFGGGALGIVIGPDGDVWVANTNTNAVSRLGPLGGLRKRITVTGSPSGLSLDDAGKVWVTSQTQNTALRIDPNAGSDGLGAVDLTVALGAGAGPQTFGDMAARITASVVAPEGTWSVVHDGGRAAVEWSAIAWHGDEPAGTQLTVEARAAESPADLDALPWIPAGNGVGLGAGVLRGRFAALRVHFTPAPAVNASPVLGDLSLTGTANRAPDCTTAQAKIERIWPPNGRMVAVPIFGVTDPDGDPVAITITGITQDEPVARRGHGGRREPDGIGVGTSLAQVRAEHAAYRWGHGNGRVYAIHFRADDNHGGTCDGQVWVCVPMELGHRGACKDDGQVYDSTVSDPVCPGRHRLETWPHPNPFNPSTTLHYELPQQVRVRVAVYDVRGQQVRLLADEDQPAGPQALYWDGRDARGNALPTGVYLYRVDAGVFEAHGRLVMVK